MPRNVCVCMAVTVLCGRSHRPRTVWCLTDDNNQKQSSRTGKVVRRKSTICRLFRVRRRVTRISQGRCCSKRTSINVSSETHKWPWKCFGLGYRTRYVLNRTNSIASHHSGRTDQNYRNCNANLTRAPSPMQPSELRRLREFYAISSLCFHRQKLWTRGGYVLISKRCRGRRFTPALTHATRYLRTKGPYKQFKKTCTLYYKVHFDFEIQIFHFAMTS